MWLFLDRVMFPITWLRKKMLLSLAAQHFFCRHVTSVFCHLLMSHRCNFHWPRSNKQPPFPRSGGGKPNFKANINVNVKTRSSVSFQEKLAETSVNVKGSQKLYQTYCANSLVSFFSDNNLFNTHRLMKDGKIIWGTDFTSQKLPTYAV